MTDNQINSLNMANTTTAFLDKNLPIFTASTKVTGLLAAIKASVLAINQTATTQSLNTKGATLTKKQLQKIAADKAEHVASGLQSYYEDINDLTLATEFHFTNSDFFHGATAEIINRMQLIRDKAVTILPAPATLQAFQVSATDITDLQTAITNFSNAAPTKKVLQAAATAATTLLTSQFTTLRAQLNKLDTLIKNYQSAQPTFAESYLNARKIINLGKTIKAIELNLMPHHFEPIFGKKFKEGDTFTVRNHSTVPITLFLTDTPTTLPSTSGIIVNPDAEIKVSVSKDFGNHFGHWLIVFNPNNLDDAHVTTILAHGKSNSQATPIGNVSA